MSNRFIYSALTCMFFTTSSFAGSENFYTPKPIKNSYLTDVQCPDVHNPVLKVTSCSTSDHSKGISTIYFRSGFAWKVNFLAFDRTDNGYIVDKEIEVDLNSENNPKSIKFAKNLIDLLTPTMRAACNASAEEREHVLRVLLENKLRLDCR